MPRDVLSHITTWVFDLDRTLYPPEADLFGLMNPRITRWISDHLRLSEAEADRLRLAYWRRYGTTLTGLMREHGLDPLPYLEQIHDIDLGRLVPDPELAAQIRALPGRRIVFTNATAPYAERVLEARGLAGLFHRIYGLEHANFRPKPEREAFEAIFIADGLPHRTAAMFEDEARNLIVPHAMGLATIHVTAKAETGAHIHHHTPNLNGFLSQLGHGPLSLLSRGADNSA